MNKFYTTFFLACFLSLPLYAQQQQTVGLRLEFWPKERGAELSYQRTITDFVRVEIGAGVQRLNTTDFLYGVGTIQALWNISGGFNWYVGGGVQLGYYKFNPIDIEEASRQGFGWGIPLQVGIEYDFSEKGSPFLLSLDARPFVLSTNDLKGFGRAYGFSLRYQL